MGELPIGSDGPSISDDSVHDQHPILTSIEQRLGVLPNFFRLTSASPEITANLWGFAQFAYLDNPLPSLFKERLFVFLSRFCEIRYCVTRHLGFLIGLGRPAGDANVGTQTIDEALRLLCRNLPRGMHVDSHIDRCVTLQSPIDDMPAVESELEEAIFICAAHVFLHTPDAARSLTALKRALGSRFEHLMVFLTFVRSAHQWTQMHPELELENDMKQLLAADQILAQRLLDDPEVMSCQKTNELMHELETLRDTKRRDAELTRLAAEFQFLKQAIDASSIVATTDAKGTITYANDKFCEISGFSRQELVGQNHRIINSGLHSREFFRDMYRAISHGNVWRGDIRNRRKDGSYYWVDTTIVPEMSSDGKPLRYVAIRNEITLRKQTENALRESESRFRMMADGLPLIVWVHDAEGNLEFVNQTFCSFFGVTHQRMRGGEWKALLHPEDAEAYANEFARCVREQCYFNAAVRVRDVHDQWRWVEAWAQPRRSESGEFLGFIGTSADITDRKLAETALREGDRRKNEFLATLSHELRNPLATIMSGLEIIKLKPQDNSLVAETRQMMERQLSLLVALVDDLLEISRISQGKLKLRCELVNLTDAITSAIETCRPQIDDACHELTVNLPAQPICVQGDSHRLSQLFANIIGNATKYTPRGGKIEINSHRNGNNLIVAVKDSGIGIASDQLACVFDMFAQVDKGESFGYNGLGIGLSLVKSLVELHGGAITATSDGKGAGSTFTVRLPVAQIETASLVANTIIPSAVPTGRRVLVVDDNSDAVKLLAIVVKTLGHEVITASNGQEAVERGREFAPDIIIMDIGMPVMNGYQAAQAIRSEAWGAGIFLIALTGWGQEDVKQKARDAGFDQHLVKPIEPEKIKKILSSV